MKRPPKESRPPTPAYRAAALDDLRVQIDHLDQQIVVLLAQRRRVVQQVAEVKQQHDLPLYHPAREENLISARREEATRAGLDPDFVEDIFRTVMRYSRTKQLDTLARRSARPGAEVLIVGGRGKMGTFLGRWFTQSDYAVRVLGRDDWPRVRALTAGIELALLAVPIQATPAVARRLGPYLAPDCLLADITSLKTEPLAAMLQGHRGPVVGLHPLFGPNTVSLDKQIVVVSPGRDPAAGAWLLEQFALWGSVLVETPPQAHDEIMGIVQAVRHFATFAFGQFLCARRVSIARTLELSSPIYRLEMGMVGRLFAQDPALYAQIIFANPERRALLQEYLRSLHQHIALVKQGDKAAFIAQFRKVAKWFGPFSEQAMRETTWLIDQLVHRF
jgi:chorismate mutase/prephenate dehydrogenase